MRYFNGVLENQVGIDWKHGFSTGPAFGSLEVAGVIVWPVIATATTGRVGARSEKLRTRE